MPRRAIDWREMMADRYDASYIFTVSPIATLHQCIIGKSYLAMREPMKESPLLYILNLKYNITVSASAGSCHNILVERKRDEDDDDQKVDNSTNASHALRDFALVMFAHVDSPQARFHERWTQPSNHGISGTECNATERQRCDEWLAIGLEVIDENADAGCR